MLFRHYTLSHALSLTLTLRGSIRDRDKVSSNATTSIDLKGPEKYQRDCSGRTLLRYDNRSEKAAKRVLVLASDQSSSVLGEGRIRLMDGSSKVALLLFYQLYTFCVVHGNRCFSVVHCSLGSKRRKTHIELLNVVKGLLSMMQAELANLHYECKLTKVFPEVKLSGFNFRFGHAL